MWRSEKARNSAIRSMLASTPAVSRLWSETGPTDAAVELLERGGGYLSSGERVVLRAAFDLWNGQGNCKVGELLDTLDAVRLRAVANAILARDERDVPTIEWRDDGKGFRHG